VVHPPLDPPQKLNKLTIHSHLTSISTAITLNTDTCPKCLTSYIARQQCSARLAYYDCYLKCYPFCYCADVQTFCKCNSKCRLECCDVNTYTVILRNIFCSNCSTRHKLDLLQLIYQCLLFYHLHFTDFSCKFSST